MSCVTPLRFSSGTDRTSGHLSYVKINQLWQKPVHLFSGQTDWIFAGIVSHVSKMSITAADLQLLIRACFFLHPFKYKLFHSVLLLSSPSDDEHVSHTVTLFTFSGTLSSCPRSKVSHQMPCQEPPSRCGSNAERPPRRYHERHHI